MCVCVCVCVCVYSISPPGARCDPRSIFKAGLNLVFFVVLTGWFTRAKELCLSNYLPIPRVKKGLMPFARILTRTEKKTVTSSIWTLVLSSISYDDNSYAMYAWVCANERGRERENVFIFFLGLLNLFSKFSLFL